MKVLHHHANKHVEDKEANDEQEGDEIQQHPWVVVGHRLGLERHIGDGIWCKTMRKMDMRKKTDERGRFIS